MKAMIWYEEGDSGLELADIIGLVFELWPILKETAKISPSGVLRVKKVEPASLVVTFYEFKPHTVFVWTAPYKGQTYMKHDDLVNMFLKSKQ